MQILALLPYISASSLLASSNTNGGDGVQVNNLNSDGSLRTKSTESTDSIFSTSSNGSFSIHLKPGDLSSMALSMLKKPFGALSVNVQKRTLWAGMPEGLSSRPGTIIETYRKSSSGLDHGLLLSRNADSIDVATARSAKLIQSRQEDGKYVCIYTTNELKNPAAFKEFVQDILAGQSKTDYETALKAHKERLKTGNYFGFVLHVWNSEVDCGFYNLGMPDYYFPQPSFELGKTTIVSDTVDQRLLGTATIQVTDSRFTKTNDATKEIVPVRHVNVCLTSPFARHLAASYDSLDALLSHSQMTGTFPYSLPMDTTGSTCGQMRCSLLKTNSPGNDSKIGQALILESLSDLFDKEGISGLRMTGFHSRDAILAKLFQNNDRNPTCIELLTWYSKTGCEITRTEETLLKSGK